MAGREVVTGMSFDAKKAELNYDTAPFDELLQESIGKLDVLRLEPNDRLLVTIDTAFLHHDYAEQVRHKVAEWAGIPPERVMVVDGSASVSVVRLDGV